MPRPKSKKELFELGKTNYNSLIDLISSYPKEEQILDFPEGTMNRNIRDVLAHLHHWHLMFLNWYAVGMKGEKPYMPAEGYSWKMTPQLNSWIWNHYKNNDLNEVKKDFKKSFKKVWKIIEKHTNEELFTKKKYKWTGTTSLGAYLVSCTSSHYDWALKLIIKGKKARS